VLTSYFLHVTGQRVFVPKVLLGQFSLVIILLFRPSDGVH